MRSPEARLQDLLRQLVVKDFPAVSIAVGKGDQTVWQHAAGYSQKGIKNTPETLFGVGSVTKVFVAVAILQLVEEGRIALDQPLARWLEKPVLFGIANGENVTVRQLLSHYAGVPSWEDRPLWIREARGQQADPTKRWLPSDTLACIRGEKPLCRPGEAFYYSNSNFTLLGLLIERVTQNKLNDELENRIFRPLSLARTGLEGFPAFVRPNTADRFHRLDASFIRNAGISDYFKPAPGKLLNVSATNLCVEWAAGGLLSTAQELMTFMLALKNGRLLNPQSLREMQRWLPADEAQIGLSLFRIKTPYGTALGHGGNVLGFSACVWWYEDVDSAVAILTNVGSMHAAPAANCASALFKNSEIGRLAQEISAQGG